MKTKIKLARDVKSQFPSQPQVAQSYATSLHKGKKPPRPVSSEDTAEPRRGTGTGAAVGTVTRPPPSATGGAVPPYNMWVPG